MIRVQPEQIDRNHLTSHLLARVIILDASVLIGHFEPADAHHTEATALLKSHASETFAASVAPSPRYTSALPGPHRPTGSATCWRSCRSRAWTSRQEPPVASVNCAPPPT